MNQNEKNLPDGIPVGLYDQERMVQNLYRWAEITEACLLLRREFLRTVKPDDEIDGLLFSRRVKL